MALLLNISAMPGASIALSCPAPDIYPSFFLPGLGISNALPLLDDA